MGLFHSCHAAADQAAELTSTSEGELTPLETRKTVPRRPPTPATAMLVELHFSNLGSSEPVRDPAGKGEVSRTQRVFYLGLESACVPSARSV
jgi:hypothetical protein